MTYTLGLAIIVALGMLLEYRMYYNPFWTLSDKLLPGVFIIEGNAAGDVTDHIGRRLVRGPAEVPLEAVAMLSMALPIALVRVLHEPRVRQRMLYGLAIIVLIAAAFATYRKSALVVPVSVVCALAYFRRRELLRLAPLGMVTLIIVSTLAPGAIGSTIRQFTRSDAAALPTVSDRASDYDAIRPDVWSHILLGRGWGSYNHESYRILDSEILLRTIETGVLGLLAFLLVGISRGRVLAQGDRRPRRRDRADRAHRRAGRGGVPRRRLAVRRALVPARGIHLPVHGRPRDGRPPAHRRGSPRRRRRRWPWRGHRHPNDSRAHPRCKSRSSWCVDPVWHSAGASGTCGCFGRSWRRARCWRS